MAENITEKRKEEFKNINIIKQKTLEAIKLTEDLIKIMKEFDIESNYPSIEKLNINPFYNQISPYGSLLVETHSGVPNKVYSPLGYIKITGSFTSYSSLDEEKLYKDLEDRLNLKVHKKGYIANSFTMIVGVLKVGDEDVNDDYSNEIEYNEAKKLFSAWLQEYISSK